MCNDTHVRLQVVILPKFVPVRVFVCNCAFTLTMHVFCLCVDTHVRVQVVILPKFVRVREFVCDKPLVSFSVRFHGKDHQLFIYSSCAQKIASPSKDMTHELYF